MTQSILPRCAQPAAVTDHRIQFGDAHDIMIEMPDESVELIVTSPPYPMVQMWDAIFAQQHTLIGDMLKHEMDVAFDRMHDVLDDIWHQCVRVLRPGCFLCINIGDAVRTFGGRFQLFPNAAEITRRLRVRLPALPSILWRKPTNAPNKFMGSGMLPGGAYVTLEHEHILVFRKPGNRSYCPGIRHSSAYFWEERNEWFSDLWTFPGVNQKAIEGSERRTAAFNPELPFRLIQMYSVRGDTVLDPFVGTGTTTLAAIAACRNSLGFEIDRGILVPPSLPVAQARALLRVTRHERFVIDKLTEEERSKYINAMHGFPVKTRMERDIVVYLPAELRASEDQNQVSYEVEYEVCQTTK